MTEQTPPSFPNPLEALTSAVPDIKEPLEAIKTATISEVVKQDTTSLNPHVRYKRMPLTMSEILESMLNHVKPDGTTLKNDLAVTLLSKALIHGDLDTAKFIVDQSEKHPNKVVNDSAKLSTDDLDLSQLSLEELRTLKDLQMKARRKQQSSTKDSLK